MMKKMIDTLYINEMVVPCILGVFADERRKKQPVIITVALAIDTQKAGRTDNIHDTVDYHNLYEEIADIVGNSRFSLLEKLAQTVADICLKDKKVQEVVVKIEKPNAVKIGKSSAIEITRKND